MLGAHMRRKLALPLAIFATCAAIYVLTLGQRAFEPSPNNHFVHLADSFLHGQLSVVGNQPPGYNDWARYEGRWFVSFPPFPALVILPAVAIWGTATLDRLFWAIIAALGPALLFVLLQRLPERGESTRNTRDNLLLTGLFALGSVFFYVAVQGTVWFAAHVVASSLIALYLLFSLDAKHPLLAGAMLGFSFLTRTTTALLVIVFMVEAFRVYRRPTTRAHDAGGTGNAYGNANLRNATNSDGSDWPPRIAWRFLEGADWPRVIKSGVLFALPVLACSAFQLWMNAARFDDPLTFGHEHLQVRWQKRIETWGLFNFHYFSKNLAVFVAGTPWITNSAPHLKISGHGLALWFTTPNLLWLLWPKRIDARMVGLYLAASCVMLLNLCYQNSGWVQFGYRFALDYMPLLFVLLALGARRFGPGFWLCALFAVAVNAFGAASFDRAPAYYDNDGTQNRVFQPD